MMRQKVLNWPRGQNLIDRFRMGCVKCLKDQLPTEIWILSCRLIKGFNGPEIFLSRTVSALQDHVVSPRVLAAVALNERGDKLVALCFVHTG